MQARQEVLNTALAQHCQKVHPFQPILVKGQTEETLLASYESKKQAGPTPAALAEERSGINTKWGFKCRNIDAIGAFA